MNKALDSLALPPVNNSPPDKRALGTDRWTPPSRRTITNDEDLPPTPHALRLAAAVPSAGVTRLSGLSRGTNHPPIIYKGYE